jgi:hypothetical protein
MAKQRKEKEDEKGLLYIKADSTNDICRYVYNFDFTSSNLLLSTGHDKRLIALGESFEDFTIAYYCNVAETLKLIEYIPPAEGEKERSLLLEKPRQTNDHHINVISLDVTNFKEVNKTRFHSHSVSSIAMGSVSDLVKAAIRKSLRSESFAHLYSFEHSGKRVIAGFDLIEGLPEDKRRLYYVIHEGQKSSFVRYSYREDTYEFVDIIGEHQYLYAKIINLTESFPFFKPKG